MVQRSALCAVVLLALAISAAGDEEIDAVGRVLVTCGSVIKLQHERLRFVLHSHEVSYGYGRGSGQQSVTGFPGKESAESFWIVRGPEGVGSCAQGTPIENGAKIKLQHSATRRWLHSHHFSSPLSGSQEVSCFGSDEETDTGDVWEVEWDGKAEVWVRDMTVRLRHIDTGVYLATHDVKYQRPIPGHSEVYGAKAKNPACIWRVTEGVFFPQRKAEA